MPLRVIKIVTCLALLLPSLTAVANPPGPLDQYTLRVDVQPAESRLEGRAEILWTNRSIRSVDHLVFHLYLNAFASSESRLMRESEGYLRGRPLRVGGGITIHSIQVDGQGDLLPEADDELIPGDRTQLRLPLGRPCPAAESLHIVIAFTVDMPEIAIRSGISDGVVFGAQFFPKLARLEPNGSWASFPYHALGEFYADFAAYELRVQAPTGYVVASGGTPLPPLDDLPGYSRFRLEPAHDIAFTAWDGYRVHETNHTGHRIQVLSDADHQDLARRQGDLIGDAVSYFEEHFGLYPYESLTAVIPPPVAQGAAGMEYPSFVTTGGPRWPTPGTSLPWELVTVHEVAHQWFQGMVASHEVQWPMLDEGIATWAHCDYLSHRYGLYRSAVALGPWSLGCFESLRAQTLSPRLPPPGQPAHAFESSSSYGASVYALTALTLETIARTWGRDRLRRALGVYARRYRFQHPTPDDLFRVFDEVYWAGFAREVLAPPLLEGSRGAIRLVSLAPLGDPGAATAEREPGPAIPLSVRLVDTSGRAWREVWASHERTFSTRSPVPLRSIEVDPDGHYLLDSKRLDNGAVAASASLEQRSFFGRALVFALALLGLVSP